MTGAAVRELVFLLEEPSMKALLEGLLPRFHPELSFRCVTFEGKQDLERGIAKTLRAWRVPGVRFVVARDRDRDDCKVLKARLVGHCVAGGRPDAVVRIVCPELEAWYLGDCEALAEAFGNERLRALSARERFRDPDSVVRPAAALAELVPEFQKVSGARRMAAVMRRDGNASRSFQVFMDVVARAAASTP